MAGDSAERVGVLIMDLASQRIAARRGDFGRGDAVFQRVGGPVHRLVHAERLEDSSGQELVERFAGDDFDQQSQNVGSKIGVDVLGTRTPFQRSAQDQSASLERGLGDAPYVASSRQP